MASAPPVSGADAAAASPCLAELPQGADLQLHGPTTIKPVADAAAGESWRAAGCSACASGACSGLGGSGSASSSAAAFPPSRLRGRGVAVLSTGGTISMLPTGAMAAAAGGRA